MPTRFFAKIYRDHEPLELHRGEVSNGLISPSACIFSLKMVSWETKKWSKRRVSSCDGAVNLGFRAKLWCKNCFRTQFMTAPWYSDGFVARRHLGDEVRQGQTTRPKSGQAKKLQGGSGEFCGYPALFLGYVFFPVGTTRACKRP